MKKLLTVLAILTLLGCEVEETGCNCVESIYEKETYIYFDGNGLPHTGLREVFVSSGSVSCQDEILTLTSIGSSALSHKIICN